MKMGSTLLTQPGSIPMSVNYADADYSRSMIKQFDAARIGKDVLISCCVVRYPGSMVGNLGLHMEGSELCLPLMAHKVDEYIAK